MPVVPLKPLMCARDRVERLTFNKHECAHDQLASPSGNRQRSDFSSDGSVTVDYNRPGRRLCNHSSAAGAKNADQTCAGVHQTCPNRRIRKNSMHWVGSESRSCYTRCLRVMHRVALLQLCSNTYTQPHVHSKLLIATPCLCAVHQGEQSKGYACIQKLAGAAKPCTPPLVISRKRMVCA